MNDLKNTTTQSQFDPRTLFPVFVKYLELHGAVCFGTFSPADHLIGGGTKVRVYLNGQNIGVLSYRNESEEEFFHYEGPLPRSLRLSPQRVCDSTSMIRHPREIAFVYAKQHDKGERRDGWGVPFP